MSRVIVYGAGAIGGVVGGRLHQAGVDVTLIARGEHLRAIRRDGLTVTSMTATVTLPVAAVGDPGDAAIGDDDIVLLAVKSQHTAAVLERLAATAPPGITVACLQNGVGNERAALRHFPHVVGVHVAMPALHLHPGQVTANGTPFEGLFDIGCFPRGADSRAAAVADVLTLGGFDCRVVDDVMRWKYRKLVTNLTNAIDVVCGTAARGGELGRLARLEGERCLAAAGIAVATADEDAARRNGRLTWRLADEDRHTGSSTWQSVARGSSSIEVDYLNGEIVTEARLHGEQAPINELLQRLAHAVASGSESGYAEDDLLALLGRPRPERSQ